MSTDMDPLPPLSVPGSDGPIIRLEDSLHEGRAVFFCCLGFMEAGPLPGFVVCRPDGGPAFFLLFLTVALMCGYGGYERASAHSSESLFYVQ